MTVSNEKANYAQGVLVFNITETQHFALGTLKVREIVPYKPMHVLPSSDITVKGAIEMRGQTIPVLDLAAAIGYTPLTEEQIKKCVIVVTDCQRKTVGFLVRSIDRIMELNWREVKKPPHSLGRNTFITGICRVDNELIQMVDLEYVMSNVFPEDNSEDHAVLTDIQREQLKPLNILLVDDSMVARKQLTDALSYINVPFKVTKNGDDALIIMQAEAANGSPIDLLVSDIEMPGLDGYELAFEVRDKPALAAAYIVLHSSLSSDISVSQATQVGANEALTKFNVQELIASMLRGAEYKASANNQPEK
ncbi:MAG: two-component system chemotaxis response regulator CheV [Cellvibrionaceae bacterium]|jgi:two-component system chemotaxis response regulator CheV